MANKILCNETNKVITLLNSKFVPNNISNIKSCYGCGVCAVACPKHIIRLSLNKNGFYEPQIEQTNQCTECGLCLDVCAFNHDEIAEMPQSIIHSYAAWSKDKRVQRKCSSGGVGFEIGRVLIEEGYKVCGVRYNAEEARAEHYMAATKEELIQSVGSKYIQSYTLDGFSGINRKDRFLITGTPCQIDSFRRLIRQRRIEDSFVLLDFFCHSVPSMLAWRYYLKQVEKKVGRVTYASWRNKQTGWQDSWNMAMDGEVHGEPVDWHDSYDMLIREKKTFINSRKSQGDLFYKFFLGDYCCNPACQKNCKYKYRSSSADLRIGDLWGKTYQDNQDGVSALIAFTPKGKEVVDRLKDCTLVEHPFEVVAEGQMKKNAGKAVVASWMMKCLKSDAPLCVINGVILVERVVRKLKSIVR